MRRLGFAIWLAAAAGACDSAPTFSDGSGANAGAAGTSPLSSGGSSDSAGQAGFGGQVSYGGSAGIGGSLGAQGPMCAGGCIHSLGTTGQIEGSEFEADEGELVRAVVRSQTGTTVVSGRILQGAFSLSWNTRPPPGSCSCSVVGNDVPNALVFADRNGSGKCEADSDWFVVREGAFPEGSLQVMLTPSDKICAMATDPALFTLFADVCAGLPSSCPDIANAGAGGDAATAGAGGDAAVGGAP